MTRRRSIIKRDTRPTTMKLDPTKLTITDFNQTPNGNADISALAAEPPAPDITVSTTALAADMVERANEVTTTDTHRLNWLAADPERLEDAFYRASGEGVSVRDAVDWLMAQVGEE